MAKSLNMNYLQLTIDAPAEWEDIFSALCFAHGAAGVQVDDPNLIQAHLLAGDWDASVFDGQKLELGRVTLHAQFKTEADFGALTAACAALAGAEQITWQVESLAERDWLQEWRDNFPDLRLGEKILIRPHWRAAATAPANLLQVLVSPGMAFGTGDHATTALAAELLEHYLKPGYRLLDLGTGSGILAVLALKLGAGVVLALDVDETSRQSVEEHWRLNNCDSEHVPLLIADILTDPEAQKACRAFQADVVVANIVSKVLIPLAPLVGGFLKPGGYWLLSGVLAEKEEAVLAALVQNGWQVLERRAQGEWLAFCCRQLAQ